MTKKNKWYHVLLGTILMPLMLVLYLLDRIFLMPMIHLNSERIQDWFRDSDKVGYSIVRMIVVIIVLAIVYGIRLIV